MPDPVTIGIIGCGNISKAYFPACQKFSGLRLLACADLDSARAKAIATQYNVPQALTVEELLAHPEIELVINLTIPAAHAEIDQQIFAAGKHAFSEKPMALTYSEGKSILESARSADRRFGCAPDTVLGASIQSCRQWIDQGAIGRPVAFAAAMQGRGHERWHPSPEFYYQPGGGPMFDMGPYYLHALITLLGPVKRVSGMTSISFPTRTITSEPKKGKKIAVEVPTHIVSLLEFEAGAVGTLTTSFDLRGPSTHPVIEIYGSEGTMQVPDPNGTKGAPRIGYPDSNEWQELAVTHPYAEGSRGLGVADLAAAIRSGRDHRANERIALHALEIMEAIHSSSTDNSTILLETSCERPAPMRNDLPEYTLD